MRTRWPLVALLPALLPVATGATQLSNRETVTPDRLRGLQYRMVGPFRGGRVTAVAGVPNQLHTFYMGSTGGGVWKSTDAGTSWDNVSDGFFDSSSVGAVAVADSDPNVVYVGTGSACPRGNLQLGDGVYRSTDAGATWKHAGLQRSGLVARLRIDPRDPDRVWAAVLGDAFAPSEQRGVFRTEDGGAHWERVLFGSERAGAADLAIDPSNPRVLYAAIWRFERKPWTLVDGGEESALYKTTDGGASWVKLGGGLPSGPLGRIGVAVAAGGRGRVWAQVTAEPGKGGLYRSDDGGDSWKLINEERELETRGWYYSHLTADPLDPSTVYAMNARFWRSIDGGITFERLRTPHGDNHDLWISPADPRVMIEGSDGGAAVTLDGGLTWSSLTNQPTAEIYRLAVDGGFPYRLYGAQQDSSAISVPAWSEGGISAEQEWWQVGGGESGDVAVHPGEPIVYSGNYIGTLERFERDTGERRNVVLYPELADGVAPRDLTYRFQWNAPILLSPHDPEVLYHASHRVHRSTDRGMSWETISPDLTRDDESKQELPGGPIQHDHTGVEVYGTIFALEESPHAAGELWAGSDDGLVHLSRDAGASWQDVTPPTLAVDTTINSLEVSPHQPGRLLLAAHRYRLGEPGPLVFRTTDWGASWALLTDGTNGIPADETVRVVREDPERPGLLYAGTEHGVFVSFDDGARWQSLRLNLPLVQVADLAVHGADLAVATHGRSFWVLDDLSPLRQLAAEPGVHEARLFRPQPVPRVATGDFDSGPKPDRRPTGALLYFDLSESPPPGAALTVLDAAGNVVRTFELVSEEANGERESAPGEAQEKEPTENRPETLQVEPGLNRAVWDLRGTKPRLLDGAVMSLGYTGGARMPPGEYRVRLTLGVWSAEQPLTLLADPRLSWGGEDYDAAYALTAAVRDRLAEIHAAVRRIRSLRDQLGDLVERTEAAGLELDLETRVEPLEAALTALEEELIQTHNEASQDPLNFPPKLDNQYAYLYGELDSLEGRPGQGARQRFDDLEAIWNGHRQRLDELLGQVEQLNQELADDEVPAVLVPID